MQKLCKSYSLRRFLHILSLVHVLFSRWRRRSMRGTVIRVLLRRLTICTRMAICSRDVEICVQMRRHFI